MHVPSGNIRIGGLFGSDTCERNRCATAKRSFDSARSNQICGDARASARCKTPRKPP